MRTLREASLAIYMKTPSAASQNWQLAYRAATSHIATDGDARFGRTASLITPRLYLSDYFTARDEDTLARLGITHVVSVLEMEPMLPARIPAENRLHVKLLDNTGEDILSRLDETTEYIKRALAENEHNKVLVSIHLWRTHSGAGFSSLNSRKDNYSLQKRFP